MKESAKYAKLVEWSSEDGCYVGRAPGLLFGGCHVDDEKVVFEDLCVIVEEIIAIYHNEGRTLPPATSGKDFANRMQDAAGQANNAIAPLEYSPRRSQILVRNLPRADVIS